MTASIKKEIMEHIRSGRLLLLTILFVMFGVMNPATAKLTPWLMEMMEESLAQTGIVLAPMEVTALDSWAQFYKNISTALIAFILIEGSIFTKEYQSGTLVLSLTKGLDRYKVVLSKTLVLSVLWTACYWACYGITYAYNAYYWDNSVAQNLLFSAAGWWLFGMLMVALTVLFSTILRSGALVLLCTGGGFMVCYLPLIIPKVAKYSPAYLMDGTSLVYGLEQPKNYLVALGITAVLTVGCLIASIPIFNRKQL